MEPGRALRGALINIGLHRLLHEEHGSNRHELTQWGSELTFQVVGKSSVFPGWQGNM